MTSQERRAWFIVVALFIILLLLFGSGASTFAVFLPALLRAFPHWSRTRVSLLPSVSAIAFGVSVIPLGWLLDRVEAKILMLCGAVGAAGAFVLASHSNSLSALVAAYCLMGIGLAAATLGPATFVVANWFEAHRGLAMGIALSGTTAGGMVMTLVANRLILSAGWRMAYLVLASPMILLAVPLVALAVRSRPPGAVKATIAQGAECLEGFETAEAVRTRSFWMLVVAHFCFWFNAAGLIHLIAYLEGLGYNASTAALAYSVLLGFGGVGKIAAGHIADRVGARLALAASFVWMALALTTVFYAAHALLLTAFIVVFGIAGATPVVLLPLLLAESLGRRRYGMLGALIGIAGTLGAAAGPVAAGQIFDLLGSYRGAFELFILLEAIGAVVALACEPYTPRAQVSIAPIATRA